jgi:hypothetical protein
VGVGVAETTAGWGLAAGVKVGTVIEKAEALKTDGEVANVNQKTPIRPAKRSIVPAHITKVTGSSGLNLSTVHYAPLKIRMKAEG